MKRIKITYNGALQRKYVWVKFMIFKNESLMENRQIGGEIDNQNTLNKLQLKLQRSIIRIEKFMLYHCILKMEDRSLMKFIQVHKSNAVNQISLYQNNQNESISFSVTVITHSVCFLSVVQMNIVLGWFECAEVAIEQHEVNSKSQILVLHYRPNDLLTSCQLLQKGNWSQVQSLSLNSLGSSDSQEKIQPSQSSQKPPSLVIKTLFQSLVANFNKRDFQFFNQNWFLQILNFLEIEGQLLRREEKKRLYLKKLIL